MKRRLKFFWSMLMCMSLLVLYVVPVNAADGCAHVNVAIQPYNDYTMLDAGQHQVVHYTRYFCMDCKKVIRLYSQTMGPERHSLEYISVRHTGEVHDYIIRCKKCSYSQLTCIPCDGGSTHATPW